MSDILIEYLSITLLLSLIFIPKNSLIFYITQRLTHRPFLKIIKLIVEVKFTNYLQTFITKSSIIKIKKGR